MIWSLLSEAWPILLAVAAFLGWGVYQRKEGASKERAKQDAERSKARDTAAKVDDTIAKQSPDASRDALKTWGPDS